MDDLVDYLKRLSSGHTPGADASTLEFATIVAPDADPAARDGMLNVLQRYFEERNGSSIGETTGPLVHEGRPVELRAQRHWQLHVWQLTGPPDGWEAQLDGFLRREPVFAVISGLAGATWEPVHRFCERQALPCLLPNVDLPVVQEGSFYSVYFSQGVLLEARLLASSLRRPAGDRVKGRIVQVFRSGDIGAPAAARLRMALADDVKLIDRALQPGDGAAALADALSDIRHGDVLVLWLRGPDLATLPAPPRRLSAVYASGILGGLERAPLAPAWKDLARLTYPFALPVERSEGLSEPLGWFQLHRIAIVDERVQVQTYVACSVLLETLASMLDEYVRDYLVERLEAMMDMQMVNGYYTGLSLAPGQRFASKGGYLVRFSGTRSDAVVAEDGWIVPDTP